MIETEKLKWRTRLRRSVGRFAREIAQKSDIIRWWRRPDTPRGMVALAVTAVVLLAVRIVFRHHPDTLLTSLLADVTEAVLVSVLIAVSADRYLRRRFFLEATRELLWALLSPKAPDVHRLAVEKVAREKTIYREVEWDVEFSESTQPTVIVLTLTVITHGSCDKLDGYRPFGKRFLLASTAGFDSEYLRYRLEGDWQVEPQNRPVLVHHDADEADGIHAIGSYLSTEESHVRLDEDSIADALIGTGRLRRESPFRIERQTRVYRHRRGFLPLVTVQPTLTTAITVKVAASLRLTVTVMEAASGDVRVLLPNERHSFDYSAPGGALILRWQQLGHSDVD